MITNNNSIVGCDLFMTLVNLLYKGSFYFKYTIQVKNICRELNRNQAMKYDNFRNLNIDFFKPSK